MNTVNLTGRLVRENELKKLGAHSNVQNVIAVRRNFKNANGEYETDFVNIVVWRGQADVLANYTEKGSLIGVQGRIQTRNYENQQGQKVYVTEVVAENIDLLETKSTQNNGSSNAQSNYQGNNQMNNYSGGNQAQGYQNTQNNVSDGTPVNISEDDLPF